MLRVLISPSTYRILDFQEKQNPFVEKDTVINSAKAEKAHTTLASALANSVVYKVTEEPRNPIPDIVFAANGGLSLPRLPEKVLILPNMKYPQRKAELSYLKAIADSQKIKTVFFPHNAVFEGQAEAKWFFGGKVLLCGYGYRATKHSFSILAKLLNNIYTYYGVLPPKVVAIPIKDPKFFHLDAAMLEYDNKVIVHRRAFSPATIQVLKITLGHENVTAINTDDDFCLNAIVDNKHLITHTLKDPLVGPILERLTGRKVIQIDATEFEKSGGSVRCMVLDIHPTILFHQSN
jgi:N-dimethylarginine dimethylaminohydrolase